MRREETSLPQKCSQYCMKAKHFSMKKKLKTMKKYFEKYSSGKYITHIFIILTVFKIKVKQIICDFIPSLSIFSSLSCLFFSLVLLIIE